MNNFWCYFLILLSTVSLGILAFSKEIAKGMNTKWLDKLTFKITILIFFVALGTWGTVEKEKNSDDKIEGQSRTINSLKAQFLKELKGEGFPLVKGFIVDKNRIILALENKKALPIYSLNVGFSDAFDLIKDEKDYPNDESHGAPIKNIPILSIPPNVEYIFYEKKVHSFEDRQLYYYLRVSWRDNSYACSITFDIDEELSVMTPQIIYEYHGKNYSCREFETKFCEAK
jgi:hypothetical protein